MIDIFFERESENRKKIRKKKTLVLSVLFYLFYLKNYSKKYKMLAF